MKRRGALRHPASGAGNIKCDGHDRDHLYEVKSTAKKQFVLKADELRRDFVRAVRQNRMACWLIVFEDAGFTAEVRLVPGGRELVG